MTLQYKDTQRNISGAGPTVVAGQGITAIQDKATNSIEVGNVYGHGSSLQISLNLSDLVSAAAAATNLGLGTGSSPTFVGVTLSGLTASLPVVTSTLRALASLAYTGATSFRKNLSLETSNSPTFVGLTLSGLTVSKLVATNGSDALASSAYADSDISGLLSSSHARQHALDATADHTIGSLTSTYLIKSNGSILVPASNTDAEVASAVSLKHGQSHALDSTSDHSIGGLTSTYLVKSDGTKLVPATNTDAQVSGAVSASHARQHSITSTSDHTSTATSGKVLKADANGLPIDASNTDTDVASAVSLKHTQGTDTALGALAALTISQPVVTDGSKNLASLAYTGATSFRKNLGLETTDSPSFIATTLGTDTVPGALNLNKPDANYASIVFKRVGAVDYVIQTRADITQPNLVFRLLDTTNVMTLNSTGGVMIDALTASLPVVSDASRNLVSLAYTGATSFRKNLGLEISDSPTFIGLSTYSTSAGPDITCESTIAGRGYGGQIALKLSGANVNNNVLGSIDFYGQVAGSNTLLARITGNSLGNNNQSAGLKFYANGGGGLILGGGFDTSGQFSATNMPTVHTEGVAPAGTVTITLVRTDGGGNMGFLQVASHSSTGAGTYTQTLYAFMSRGTGFTATPLGTRLGGVGMVFTLSMAANGVITITNNDAGNADLTAGFWGYVTN